MHGAWGGVRERLRWAAIRCSTEQGVVHCFRLPVKGALAPWLVRLDERRPRAAGYASSLAAASAGGQWHCSGRAAARGGVSGGDKRGGRMQAAAAAAVVADAAVAAGALATAEAAGVFAAAAAAVGWDWRQQPRVRRPLHNDGRLDPWEGLLQTTGKFGLGGRKDAWPELLLLWSLFPQQGVLPKLGRVMVRPEEEELSTASCQPCTMLCPAQPGPCGRRWSRQQGWPR